MAFAYGPAADARRRRERRRRRVRDFEAVALPAAARPARRGEGTPRATTAMRIEPAFRKPTQHAAKNYWNAALRLLNYSPDKVLHVSAYGFYDLIPASHLGFDVAFIARDSETPPAKLKLAYQAHDLADLADQLGC